MMSPSVNAATTRQQGDDLLDMVSSLFWITIIEAFSKIGFRLKIKADSRFQPEAYFEYVEDSKR
jgi:hypothetical protein